MRQFDRTQGRVIEEYIQFNGSNKVDPVGHEFEPIASST